MRWFWLPFCLIQCTACIGVTNHEHINRRIMFIFKSPNSQFNDRCLEMLFCKWFLDESAALRPTECAVSLQLTAQNRRRERQHCDGSQTSRSQGSRLLETSSNWTIAKVYWKKLLGLSVCACWGKKATKRVWKLLNIVLKSRLCVWDAGADGIGWWILLRPATKKKNQHMGNTGDCLWECRQYLSTQNEQYKMHRVRGYLSLVNRLQMVSLSRADKK